MSRRIVRYGIYLVILLIAGLVIQRNAWKVRIWRYHLDAESIRHTLAEPPGWEYYLHVPRGYSDEREWPLLIYVHGTEGSGRDALHVWRPLADREGFFYLAPTFRLEGYQYLQNGEDKALWFMIAQIREIYAVDRDRVFICGFSGGAQFAHRFAFRYPKHVSGVSAMSAGSYDRPPQGRTKVPFAVSVGQVDTERTDLAAWFAGELQRSGYPVWYETYPAVGHWMCDQAVELTLRLFHGVSDGRAAGQPDIKGGQVCAFFTVRASGPSRNATCREPSRWPMPLAGVSSCLEPGKKGSTWIGRRNAHSSGSLTLA